MSGSYFLYGSILEKCGNFWENGHFSGRIWPDWGNAARADMAGLGSIGLNFLSPPYNLIDPNLAVPPTGAVLRCTDPVKLQIFPHFPTFFQKETFRRC